MDFASRIQDLAERSRRATKQALTEEATKTAVIMPLLQALGFDVFNLDEVIPEYVADVGIKKGEKIDFALKLSGQIAILVEVKPISMSLGDAQYSQLFRYFSVSRVKLAILTNGREVWFFSDLDEQNRMDKRPFFTFDLQSYDERQVEELARFQKQQFNIEAIVEAASTLRYVKAGAAFIKQQLSKPSDEFVKMAFRDSYEGSFTKAALEQLRPAVQSAIDEVIRERIQDRLNVAFHPKASATDGTAEAGAPTESGIETTDDERMGFFIVQAIAARVIDVSRVAIRDAKSYCSIFVDDNNRKPICRLYFNGKTNKAIGIFDASRVETRVQIQNLRDIYKFSEAIETAAKVYC